MRVINHTATKGPNAKYNREGYAFRFQVTEGGNVTDIHGNKTNTVKSLKRVVVIEAGESTISKSDFDAAYRDGTGLLTEAVKVGNLEFPDHPALKKVFGVNRNLEEARLAKLNVSAFTDTPNKGAGDSDVERLEDQLAEMQRRLAAMEAGNASTKQDAA